MKKIIKLLAVILLGLISMKATCGKPKPVVATLSEQIEIDDFVYFHNMSITYTGWSYVTINGGNSNYCNVNEYDEEGIYVDSYDVGLDGRAIFYNAKDEQLYVKVYGSELYTINLEDEDANVEYSDMFVEDNGSPAMSPDGKYFYELSDNEVRVLDAKTGKLTKSFKLTSYDESSTGYNVSIAASEHFLFVWGASDEIIVTNLNGKYVTTLNLPETGLGFSLSYCNGMLWIAQDADGSTDGETGYWYGYKIEGLE
jgi:VCBS repeat-containing protein